MLPGGCAPFLQGYCAGGCLRAPLISPLSSTGGVGLGEEGGGRCAFKEGRFDSRRVEGDWGKTGGLYSKVTGVTEC